MLDGNWTVWLQLIVMAIYLDMWILFLWIMSICSFPIVTWLTYFDNEHLFFSYGCDLLMYFYMLKITRIAVELISQSIVCVVYLCRSCFCLIKTGCGWIVKCMLMRVDYEMQMPELTWNFQPNLSFFLLIYNVFFLIICNQCLVVQMIKSLISVNSLIIVMSGGSQKFAFVASRFSHLAYLRMWYLPCQS